jgi:DNA-binding transcriptional MocR family regulator
MLARGYLMAPGSLFSPDQRPSTWMRFNLATSLEPPMLSALAEALEHVRSRSRPAEGA